MGRETANVRNRTACAVTLQSERRWSRAVLRTLDMTFEQSQSSEPRLAKRTNMKSHFALLFLLSLTSVAVAQESTFETIQTHVFEGNCANCHQADSTFARQSGLELTGDVSYSQLVGVEPFNTVARADGLTRVSSVGGPIGLAQSFLWEKINVADQDHFYADHPGYGALMPLGAGGLTNGELDFIKNWILEGAPPTGNVVDVSLLDDTSRFTPPEFRPLPPPESGMQIHLGPFDVWPSEVNDREFLYFQEHQTTEDQFISRYEISYRPGSHHMILYHYDEDDETPQPGVYRDIRTQDGEINVGPTFDIFRLFPFEFFVGSQEPYLNYNFPAGVALRMPPGKGFDINSHSVNQSGETRQGEIYVNLHTTDEDDIVHVADYGSFVLCRNDN